MAEKADGFDGIGKNFLSFGRIFSEAQTALQRE